MKKIVFLILWSVAVLGQTNSLSNKLLIAKKTYTSSAHSEDYYRLRKKQTQDPEEILRIDHEQADEADAIRAQYETVVLFLLPKIEAEMEKAVPKTEEDKEIIAAVGKAFHTKDVSHFPAIRVAMYLKRMEGESK